VLNYECKGHICQARQHSFLHSCTFASSVEQRLQASEAWNSFDIDEAHDNNDGMPSGGSLAT